LWIAEISKVLNAHLLPSDCYAMAEQFATDAGPDVLALRARTAGGENGAADPRGAVAVAMQPPKTRFVVDAELDFYTTRQKTIVIRHSSNDEIIALIEVLSPGNKSSARRFRSFLDKAIALSRGYHLLLIDLHPPTARDPQGIHSALWDEVNGQPPYQAPADKPLTLVSYRAGPVVRACIEPIAVGDRLPSMPLFLDEELYVPTPLEDTYQAAWEGVPERWRKVLLDIN
jgi:hypothetical protein